MAAAPVPESRAWLSVSLLPGVPVSSCRARAMTKVQHRKLC